MEHVLCDIAGPGKICSGSPLCKRNDAGTEAAVMVTKKQSVEQMRLVTDFLQAAARLTRDSRLKPVCRLPPPNFPNP